MWDTLLLILTWIGFFFILGSAFVLALAGLLVLLYETATFLQWIIHRRKRKRSPSKNLAKAVGAGALTVNEARAMTGPKITGPSDYKKDNK